MILDNQNQIVFKVETFFFSLVTYCIYLIYYHNILGLVQYHRYLHDRNKNCSHQTGVNASFCKIFKKNWFQGRNVQSLSHVQVTSCFISIKMSQIVSSLANFFSLDQYLEVTLNKSSLLLKIDLQNTPTLQPN